MRFYNLTITDPQSGKVVKQWSSLWNGAFNPDAHQIEFEAYIYNFADPKAATGIKLYGPALADIAQTNDLNGKTLTLEAGMSAGLPLANPAQRGVILVGTIQQCFGNWIGTDMTIDFVVTATGYSTTAQHNIVFDWQAGTPLATALAATLSRAFPGVKQNINVSPSLVLAHDEKGFYTTMEDFAGYLYNVTVGMLGSTYQGVEITVRNGVLTAYDGTALGKPVMLAFTDLIGQPTWLGPNKAQITTVLRADLHVGDYIALPKNYALGPGAVTFAPEQQTVQPQLRATFQGNFQVQAIRHLGNFRSPDGTMWSSTFNVTTP